jgi:hypothetical protein
MARRLAEFGRGPGLVGGQQQAEQSVVQLGVEGRDLDPVGGEDVTVGARSGCPVWIFGSERAGRVDG